MERRLHLFNYVYVDIEVGAAATAPIRFTFNWRDTGKWEGRDYAVEIEKQRL